MSNTHVSINNQDFVIYLTKEQIAGRVAELAEEIKKHYGEAKPVFLILLNGAYVFAADLIRHWEHPMETRFIKVSSYEDMESTGKIEFNRDAIKDLAGKDILIIEDIIDTGQTLKEFTGYLHSIGVKSVKIAAFLFKPGKLKYDIAADFLGFSISDLFVVGYGLDYNENARNLNAIYMLNNSNQ